MEEQESQLISLDTDLDTTERDNIHIATPTDVLFPGSDPFGGEFDILSPCFPCLMAPPGFDAIVRSGEIPDPAGPPSLFADSPDIPDGSCQSS